MTWAVVGLVLWVVVGLAGVAVIWVATVFGSGMLAMAEKTGAAATTFFGGIILALVALCLVVTNIVMSVINVVNIATNGG